MDRKEFNASRFGLIGLPSMNTYVNRSDNRDEFEAKLRPLLEAFDEPKISSIKNGDFQNLPLWIFDDYLLAEAISDSYESVGIPLSELGKALKTHSEKLEKTKLKAIAAVESLINLSVSNRDKSNLEQAIHLINGCAVDGVIKPFKREIFFAALVCLSFHCCFSQRDFKPQFDMGTLKPIARIVAVFYGGDAAIKSLNSITSKIKRGDVASVLRGIISEHLGLWGQFLNRNS